MTHRISPPLPICLFGTRVFTVGPLAPCCFSGERESRFVAVTFHLFVYSFLSMYQLSQESPHSSFAVAEIFGF
jgi:hypothetical protein